MLQHIVFIAASSDVGLVCLCPNVCLFCPTLAGSRYSILRLLFRYRILGWEKGSTSCKYSHTFYVQYPIGSILIPDETNKHLNWHFFFYLFWQSSLNLVIRSTIHTPRLLELSCKTLTWTTGNNFGFIVSSKATDLWSQEKLGIKPPVLW